MHISLLVICVSSSFVSLINNCQASTLQGQGLPQLKCWGGGLYPLAPVVPTPLIHMHTYIHTYIATCVCNCDSTVTTVLHIFFYTYLFGNHQLNVIYNYCTHVCFVLPWKYKSPCKFTKINFTKISNYIAINKNSNIAIWHMYWAINGYILYAHE